ncbi:MAG: enoyl-CoA hydratase/isomerase family protein, partial [Burkholderiales bacterium]|nr:enoyl-CoA hydratase/isomerase family protein [Burkholderiales bacterium]
MNGLVRTRQLGRVLVATLARAPVNAFDDALIDALSPVVDRAEADPGIALLHLRSEERAFSAGADLGFMRECFATPQGPDAMTAMVGRMQRLFARIEAAGVVSLAEIGAGALGGGLELALACDLRVAAFEARLGLPEAGLGLVPGAGGTQRLTRLCGAGVARRLVLGAEVLDGAQALALGLVQWARPLAELAAWTAELAARCAAAPKAALA